MLFADFEFSKGERAAWVRFAPAKTGGASGVRRLFVVWCAWGSGPGLAFCDEVTREGTIHFITRSTPFRLSASARVRDLCKATQTSPQVHVPRVYARAALAPCVRRYLAHKKTISPSTLQEGHV